MTLSSSHASDMNPFHGNSNVASLNPGTLIPFEDSDYGDDGADAKSQTESVCPEELYSITDDIEAFYLLKRPDIKIAAHLMTDLKFWKKRYSELSIASYKHREALLQTLDSTEKYIAELSKSGLAHQEKCHLIQEANGFRTSLTEKAKRLELEEQEYQNLAKQLKSFKDVKALQLHKLDRKYSAARKDLDKQTTVVKDIENAYYRIMLGGKADKQLERFHKHIEKWKKVAKNARELSAEFEKAYLAREEARARVVMTGIHRSMDITNTSFTVDNRNISHDQINGTFVVRDLLTREKVVVPNLKEYKHGGDMTIKQTTADLQDKHNAVNQTLDKPVEEAAVIKRVVLAYKRQEKNQLNLKLGECVTQRLPANQNGFAYGEVVRGILRRRKAGFYPATHVTDGGDTPQMSQSHIHVDGESVKTTASVDGLTKPAVVHREARDVSSEMYIYTDISKSARFSRSFMDNPPDFIRVCVNLDHGGDEGKIESVSDSKDTGTAEFNDAAVKSAPVCRVKPREKQNSRVNVL